MGPDLGAAVAKNGFRIPYRQHWAGGHSRIDGENVNHMPEFMEQRKEPSCWTATWEIADNQEAVFSLERKINRRIAGANAS